MCGTYSHLALVLLGPSLLVRELFLELGNDVLLGLVGSEELLGLGKLAGSRQEREGLLLEGSVGKHCSKLDAFLSATLKLVLEMLELI